MAMITNINADFIIGAIRDCPISNTVIYKALGHNDNFTSNIRRNGVSDKDLHKLCAILELDESDPRLYVDEAEYNTMKLTSATYYTKEADRHYMSVSQFKTFHECEEKGHAAVQRDYIRKTTKALLVGSYVDAYFSSCAELDAFTANHADELYTKKGDLRADFQRADDIIRRVERDKVMMDYLDGDPQVIMTGELFGSEWKVKVDSLHPDKIVDLKVMKDMKPIYKDAEWKDFITAWGYDIQGFVYQQIVEQNTGKHLPFYLAVATKEEHPDIEIIQIPDWKLSSAGEIVKHYTPRYQKIKNGEIEPNRCGVCDWCRDTKVLNEPISYESFIEKDL